jgi:hypothetical protein
MTLSNDLCLLLRGEGGRIGRMRDQFNLLNFLTFSVYKSPSLTTSVVLPLPKRARALSDKKTFHPKNLVCQNYDENYLEFI